MARLNEGSMTKLVQMRAGESVQDDMTPVFVKAHAGGLVRMDTYQGREYLVAPTVAVISKVLNGELLPASELSLFTESWNGRPVPLRHPTVNGIHVSVNSPDLLETYNLGYFFNAHAEDHELGARLVGEMWLDRELIEGKGGDALDAYRRLEAGEAIEVSTAYFSLVRNESGEFNGEHYDGVQYNIKPDHVALLPDEIGACSIADGCGVSVNALAPGAQAYVSVKLSPAAIVGLAVEPNDSFTPIEGAEIVLAELGEGAQVQIDQQAASEVVGYVARRIYAHTARIAGAYRTYNAAGAADEVGYLLGGGALALMRRVLVNEFEWAEQPVVGDHSWQPRIVMGYTSDVGYTLPAPGVDRIAVTALTLSFGGETVTFSLDGELGGTYQSMRSQTMNDENIDNVSGDGGGNLAANEQGEQDVQDTQGEVEPTLGEVAAFMAEVKAAGGVSAIMDALRAIQANEDARRNGAIERLKARKVALSDEVIGGMSTDALIQVADALAGSVPAANFAASQPGTVQNDGNGYQFVEGIGQVRPFAFDEN